MKRCKKCGKLKAESEFYYYDNIKKYGSECKECRGPKFVYKNKVWDKRAENSKVRCYACSIMIGDDYMYKRPKKLMALGEMRLFDRDCYRILKKKNQRARDKYLEEKGFFNIVDEYFFPKD